MVNQDVWNKAPDSPYIKLALYLKKELQTEIGLFFQLCETPIIGITGTRGKTTTTTAIAELMTEAGFKILFGGNIPNSSVLQHIEMTSELDYVVLELSNYQLRGLHLKKKSPHIAIITSIYPDHLISYASDSLQASMQSYINDKKAIYQYQDKQDYLILKQSQKYFPEFEAESQAQVVHFSENTLPDNWDLKLKGKHNLENLGAAYKLGKLLKIKDEVIKNSLTNFKGVAHRQELILEKNGVRYINDTTATTPVATTIALKTFSKGKIILLAGGNKKGLPQEELVETIAKTAKAVILIPGNATEGLKHDLLKYLSLKNPDTILKQTDIYDGYDNFSEIVQKSIELAQQDDIVLLSPGFTSFGLFANEFDRGRQFADLVKKYA